MKKRLGLVLSFLISVIFLILAFKKVNAREIGQSLLNANLSYFVIAVLLTFFTFFLRAIRWQILLNPLKKLPLPLVYHATMIGFTCNYLLPARIGEIIRAYLIGARGNMSKSSALATIIVERVLDVFILSFFTAAIVIFFSVPAWVKKIGTIISILNILIFIILVGMHKKRTIFLKIIEKIFAIFGEKIKERTKTLFSAFIEGLNILDNPINLLLVTVLSFAIWGISGLFFYALFFSFPIRLPLYAAFLDMIILTFGILLPSTTGFIGTFQFFVKEGLVIFQVNPNIALSYSILLYVSQFLPVVGPGLISLWLWGLDFKNLKADASSCNISNTKQEKQK
jgi:uncharacterized protein (TIRG00374 family)